MQVLLKTHTPRSRNITTQNCNFLSQDNTAVSEYLNLIINFSNLLALIIRSMLSYSAINPEVLILLIFFILDVLTKP